MNTQKMITVAALLAVAGSAFSQDFLVLDQNSRNSYALTAAGNLGAATQAGVGDFNALLGSQAWDAVIVDMPSTLLTDFNPLINYINSGGRVVVSTWGDPGFGGWAQLLTPMGATGGTSFSTQSNPSITSTGTPEAVAIFTGITLPITSFDQFWGSDGAQATLAGGSVGVAQQGGVGNPIVWVGNGGSTIASWVIDEMTDAGQAVLLWENYINFVLGADFCAVREGAFSPVATDDYESYPGARTEISDLFGGDVPVIPGTVTHNSVDEGNWSDFRSPGGPIVPSSGTKFGVGFGFGDFTLDFTGIGGVDGFQGMASAAGVGDDVVTFFDMAGNELCDFTIVGGFGPGDGTMVPFSYVSGVKIGSVNLNGRESTYDDLGYLQPIPCPVTEGDFTADAVEDYEGTGGGRTVINDLFGGDVPVIPGSVNHSSVDFGDWQDFRAPGGPVTPTSGSIFGVQFGFGDFTLDFTGVGGITGFKGNATAAGVGDDVVTFFDMAGNELCSFTISGGFGPGDGSMVPFSYVSDTPIGSVNLNGRESCFDDIAYTGDSACLADCDGDGALTLFDFLCFQNLFDAGDLAADLDGDGILTLFDFLTFQNLFDAGCD